MIDIDDFEKKYGCEMALLILCCRVFFETATTADLNTFTGHKEINWDEFRYLARIHRIRPVVYAVISTLQSIPESIKGALFIEQSKIIKRNWEQSIETERVINLLKQNNIEVIAYKGAAFSKQFFGNITSRESSDIDLIIKPSDLVAANTVLHQDGYIAELEDLHQYLGKQFYWHFKDYPLNKFKGAKRQFHVELHWAITENFINVNPKINAFIYGNNTNVTLIKNSVKAVDKKEHFSAILIHHSTKDTFVYIKHILDVAQAINHSEIQAGGIQLYQDFTRLGLKNVFVTGNALCMQLMGVGLKQPEDLKIVDKTINHFINRIMQRRESAIDTGSNFFEWTKSRALLRDSSAQIFKFYMVWLQYRFIPGENDFRLLQVHKSFLFIHYLIKPFRSLINPFNQVEKKRKLLPANNSIL